MTPSWRPEGLGNTPSPCVSDDAMTMNAIESKIDGYNSRMQEESKRGRIGNVSSHLLAFTEEENCLMVRLRCSRAC